MYQTVLMASSLHYRPKITSLAGSTMKVSSEEIKLEHVIKMEYCAKDFDHTQRNGSRTFPPGHFPRTFPPEKNVNNFC